MSNQDNEHNQGPERLVLTHTLRGKGWIFIGLLVAYVLVVAVYVLSQKDRMLEQFEDYGKLQAAESLLMKADLAVFEAYSDLFLMVGQPDRQEVLQKIHQHFTTLTAMNQQLGPLFPQKAESFNQLIKLLAATVIDPRAQGIAELKERLAINKHDLERLLKTNREMRAKTVLGLQRHADRVAWQAMALALFGVITALCVVTLFFSVMSRDLRYLGKRVVDIMRGERQVFTRLLRKDELGVLAEGIQSMAEQLQLRGKALDIERQSRFSREKKVDQEQLIAGLVHELGNPVAAISALGEASKEEDCQQTRGEYLEQINAYALRMQNIMTELSTLGQPLHSAYQAIDLNEVLHLGAVMLRFDERWQKVKIDYELEQALPAINGSSEQLGQLLSNILNNAFDSMGAQSEPRITLGTQVHQKGWVRLSIIDNGCGIEESVLRHVFEHFYTTKESLEGRGLGLPVCRTLVQAHKGHMELRSQVGVGTEVLIDFPTLDDDVSEELDMKEVCHD